MWTEVVALWDKLSPAWELLLAPFLSAQAPQTEKQIDIWFRGSMLAILSLLEHPLPLLPLLLQFFVCSLPYSAPHFSPCTPVLPVPMEPVGLAAQHPAFWHPRPPLYPLHICPAAAHSPHSLGGKFIREENCTAHQGCIQTGNCRTPGHCNLSDVSSHQSGEPNCLKYLKIGTLEVWVTPGSSLPPLVTSPRGGPITHVWFKKDANTKQIEGRQEGL